MTKSVVSEVPDQSVTVIICARNEAGGIGRVVQDVSPFAAEVLVVDGHSTDDTAAIAEKAGARVVQDNGRGKGDAYQVGIRAATKGIVVFIDADGSHDASDIPKLIQPLVDDKADFVIASRHKGGSDEWGGDLATWLRAIGSGFLSVVINKRWGSDFTDILNGYRAVRADVAQRVPLRAVDFDIEQHMIVQYLKAGYRGAEVGSHEYCRQWGVSKLPTFRKAYLFFWRLFLDLLYGKPELSQER
jgi:dolichol-phosphate hexosyltransferase